MLSGKDSNGYLYYYSDYTAPKPRENFIKRLNEKGLKNFLFTDNTETFPALEIFPNSNIKIKPMNFISQLYIQEFNHLNKTNYKAFIPVNEYTNKYIKDIGFKFKIENSKDSFIDRFIDITTLENTQKLLTNYNHLNKIHQNLRSPIKKFNYSKIDPSNYNGEKNFALLVEMNLRCIYNKQPYFPNKVFNKDQLKKALDFQRKYPERVFRIFDNLENKLTLEKKQYFQNLRQAQNKNSITEKIKEKIYSMAR